MTPSHSRNAWTGQKLAASPPTPAGTASSPFGGCAMPCPRLNLFSKTLSPAQSGRCNEVISELDLSGGVNHRNDRRRSAFFRSNASSRSQDLPSNSRSQLMKRFLIPFLALAVTACGGSNIKQLDCNDLINGGNGRFHLDLRPKEKTGSSPFKVLRKAYSSRDARTWRW